jgi:hypothetical protein
LGFSPLVGDYRGWSEKEMVHLDGHEFYKLEIEGDRVFHLRLILKELVSRLLLLLAWAGTTEREGLIIIKGFPDGR